MRPRVRSWLACIAIGLGGCFSAGPGGGPYRIVNRAAVNPAEGATRLVIRPPVFDGMMLYNKPLAEWERGRTPDQLASFAEDKRAFNAYLLKGVAEGNSSFDTHYASAISAEAPGAGAVAVSVQVLSLDPQVMRVRITVLGGPNRSEVVDLQVSPNVDMATFGVGREMRGGARMTGLVLVRYLSERARSPG